MPVSEYKTAAVRPPRSLPNFYLVKLLSRVYGNPDWYGHWGWIFGGGVLNLALGIMIWLQWPFSGFWGIGLFVGIDMLFSGWTWIMLALRFKHLHRARTTTTI